MRAYVGQTRGGVIARRCVELGIGEMTTRGELPPRRLPWVYDNGAFRDWTAQRPFNEASFVADVEALRELDTPDFLIVPDRVASPDSLALSLSWAPRLAGVAPLALAVQDGMTEPQVREALEGGGFSVLFVGGSLQWKLDTAPQWVRVAHAGGRRCHVGRIGSRRRVLWAREIGADSIDSCVPLFSLQNFATFERALSTAYTGGLFGPMAPPAVARSQLNRGSNE